MAEIPDWLQDGTLGLVQRGLNRILAMDPDSAQRLEPLAGRSLEIALSDAPVSVLCVFGTDGLQLSRSRDETTADATLRSSMAGLLALVTSRGARSRDAEFRGDIGVIQEVKRLFAELDVDWEEQLSHLTGDVVAHRVGETGRQGTAWSRAAGDTFLRNIGEYLTEEQRLVPAEAELSAYVDDVQRLRADVDRFEARLRRLEE